MRSADGSVGSSDAHAPAVHAPAAGPDEQRARLADDPDAERAALEHEPGARVQLARVVADEVAEQPERRRAPARRRAAGRAAARWRRAWRRAPGSPTRARARSAATGNDSGSSTNSSDRGDAERDRVGDRRERPHAPAPAQRALVDPRPPVDGRGLGQDAGARCSPARDRAAQDHELGVQRQLVAPARRGPRPR